MVAHPWVPDGRFVAYTLEFRSQGRIIAWLAGTEVGLLPSVYRMPAPAPGAEGDSADGPHAASATDWARGATDSD